MINREYPKTAKFTSQRSTSVAPNRGTQATDSRFAFTKRLLETLPTPSSRTYYYDTQQRGLVVTVFPSGQKTFCLYRRVKGRPERISIGAFPDIALEQARKRAQELNGVIASGGNPAEERRAVRDEMSFEQLFAEYLEKYARRQKRTWKEDERQFRCYLTRLAPLKLSDITRAEIVKLHDDISAYAPYAANRVVALIRKVFNWAAERGWKGENPAAKFKRNKEAKRKRFLDGEELPQFWRALAEEQNSTVRDYFLTCLLTGGRCRRNVCEMRWEEIRWKRMVWHIPGEKFKNGEAEDVQLVPVMVLLLKQRAAVPDADPVWVFPGVGRTGHLVEPKSAWKRILKRADIRNCRIHDLRRTLGSWQAIKGASLTIIGQSLGHKSLEATAIYARLDSHPVRASLQRAVDAMLAELPEDVNLLPALPVSQDSGHE